MLTIFRKDVRTVRVLRIKGALVCDNGAEQKFREAINEALGEMGAGDPLIINLQNLTDLDSSGMGLFVWANSEANSLGTRVIYTNLDKRWVDHLQIHNLFSLLRFEAEESALLEKLGEVADGIGDDHGSVGN